MKSCINGKNSISLPLLLIKLFKFEKCGQIFRCTYKPCFLMLGHACCSSFVCVPSGALTPFNILEMRYIAIS